MYLEIIDNPQKRSEWLNNNIKFEKHWIIDSQLQSRIQSAFSQYWQQRLVSLAHRDIPTARDFLTKNPFVLLSHHHSETNALPKTQKELLAKAQKLLQLNDEFLKKDIISLSNGELRRLIIARAFMQNPQQILLNDPFSGLDATNYPIVLNALHKFSRQGIQITIAQASASTPEFHKSPQNIQKTFLHNSQQASQQVIFPTADEVWCGQNLCISFGDNKIIDKLNWQILRGQRWLLSGPNGSGKSSLLTFLTGDHPQIYRNELRLFGKTPGKNFNIWEHKARLSFCSPEQHHGWRQKSTLLNTVLDAFQPLRQNPVPASKKQVSLAKDILYEMGIPAEMQFYQAPYAWQRLALVARALVAQKELVILDEPDQGLDDINRQSLWKLVDKYAQSTLVVASHHLKHIAMDFDFHLVLNDPNALYL
ncbi:MAG: ATP-binding cassette domain-containing protein [Fibrobacter sp.]|nr:ATP-binding cassette domain-containing protein [Fibrobacter sp.]